MIYKVLASICLCLSSVSFSTNDVTIDTDDNEVSNQVVLFMNK